MLEPLRKGIRKRPLCSLPFPQSDSKELYPYFISQVMDYAIFTLDPEGYVCDWNSGAERIEGYQREEILGYHYSILFEDEQIKAGHPESILNIAARAGKYQEEGWRIRKDGSRFWANALVTAVLDPGGTLKGFVKIVCDLSVKKRREEKLRQERREHEIIFNSVPAMIWYKNQENRIIRCNELASKIIGKPIQEVEGKHTEELFPIEAKKYYNDDLRVIQSREPIYGIIETLTLPSGEKRWVRTDKIPYLNDSGELQGVIVFAVDITAVKQSEQKLEILNKIGETLFSSIDFHTTLKHVARLAVPFFADWCVLDLVESKGKIDRVEVSCADPGKKHLAEIIKKYPPLWNSNHPIMKVLASQEPAIVFEEGTLKDIAQNEEHLRALESIRPRNGIIAPLIARGQTLGSMLFSYAESGRRYVPEDLVFANLIARRAAAAIDNARLYRDAQTAIALREEFVSVASHELKTPLTSLQMQIQLIQQICEKTEDSVTSMQQVCKIAGMIERDFKQQALLIHNLLDLTRIKSGQLILDREKVDLCQIIKNVISRISSDPNFRDQKVELYLPDSVLGFWDGLRLEQVISNLLSNAIKYGLGKPIEVRMEADQKIAKVMIQDQGLGIPKERQSNLFERYRRATPEKGRVSLGLGLYIAKQIVTAHEGKIYFNSEPGKGSLFTLELPLGIRQPR